MSEPTKTQLEQLRRWRLDSQAYIADNFGVSLDPWQVEACEYWDRGDQRIALQACKGPGKTALLAMLIWQFMATRPFAKVVCTSISGDNLADCLWAELAKWQQKSPVLCSAFEWTKTRIECRDHRETWFASARTWPRTANAEEQAKTLAGVHGDYVLFVLDETGGMPEAVMVAADAALASGIETRILQAGNPIQCEGPLWVAANRDRKLWTIIRISGAPNDPKRSPRISIQWAQQQIDSHGADNPWVLANVFGKFPPSSPLSFIATAAVEAAMSSEREPRALMTDPLILGVDVARFGMDQSVIYIRKGKDGRTHPPLKLRNLDNMQLAARVAELAVSYQADAIFIDGGGNGGGVIDRLRQLEVPKVFEVQFGAKPDYPKLAGSSEGDQTTYASKGAEIWGAARDWIRAGGALVDDQELRTDLISRRYGFKLVDGRDAIMLEPKDEMRKRGLDSPDTADALALTFAYPVQPHDRAGFAYAGELRGPQTVQHEYDPFNVPAPAGVVSDYDPYR